MPLKQHLLEFRNRLMKACAAIVIGAIVAWFLYDPQPGTWVNSITSFSIYDNLTSPFDDFKQTNPDSAAATINYGNATTAFSTRLSISIWAGIILSSPVWLWQIWAFILPGLTKREKKISLGIFATAVPLFLAGCLTAYWTLPKALIILFGFTPEDDKSSNIQQSGDYFNFVTRFIVAFGLAWLIPLFLVGLVAIGVLSGRQLLKSWRMAVLLIFIGSAIITPTPDPFTMFLMAGPICALYFIAVGIALLIDRRRIKEGTLEPSWSEELDDDTASPLR